MSSGIRGVTKLRRTFRRLEKETVEPVRKALRDGAEAIKLDAVARAPIDDGDLVRAIDHKISSDGLTVVIGPGAKAAEIVRRQRGSAFATRTADRPVRLSARNKDLLWQFYKGYWHEFGTKGSPKHNIPPMAARPFMGPAYRVNEGYLKAEVSRAVKAALARAVRG